ncbi:hypothetical protein POM88_006532 [Heracleum sosnowskyi]|uniref:WAT1-related protein n=1 Tax=Heracleum sosnowskyi TaxID=360622 RepID=A0AAD8J2X3_9APIA|nr:hypothetical protein POM88_006532 [Heracleum sosnowskyi]
MERVNLRQKHGLEKVIGTSITLLGAMLMTLYKDPIVNILGGYSHGSEHESLGDISSGQHWVPGTRMLLSCTIGWSAFFIVQVSFITDGLVQPVVPVPCNQSPLLGYRCGDKVYTITFV